MTNELWRLGACETAERIAKREISAAEVTQAHLERLDALNPGLNAVSVVLADDARAEADGIDAALSRGEAVGPLAGVPVTIKENADQQGQATTNGVPAYVDALASADAPAVRNLRRAGAVIIGRTNTPEFSLRWFTDNPLRGRTLNPWHSGHTPGGSSGGAAASLAQGIGALAHGSDLGGSLRYPAYCCGVATIRASLGRVPSYNGSAPAERGLATQLMSVQGPIAHTIADLRLALQVMAADGEQDPLWVPPEAQVAAASGPLRVAVSSDPAGDGVDPAVAQAIDQAAAALGEAGYEIERVDPPAVAEIAKLWGRLLMTETHLMMEAAMRRDGSQIIVGVLDAYYRTYPPSDLEGYMQGLALRNTYVREWSAFMQRYPLVLAPVSQVPAMPQGADEVAEDVEQILTWQRMLTAVNCLGLPAVALPTGLAGGLPLGVQIIAYRHREELCLAAAEAVERALGTLSEALWSRQ